MFGAASGGAWLVCFLVRRARENSKNDNSRARRRRITPKVQTNLVQINEKRGTV